MEFCQPSNHVERRLRLYHTNLQKVALKRGREKPKNDTQKRKASHTVKDIHIISQIADRIIYVYNHPPSSVIDKTLGERRASEGGRASFVLVSFAREKYFFGEGG